MSEKNKSIAFSFGSQSFNVKRELSKRFKADKVNDIIKKTGPLKLRWTSKKENTLSLSLKAYNKLNLSKIEKEKINNIIFVTESPIYQFPGNGYIFASLLNFKNNINITDINSGCTGFVDALNIAQSFDGSSLIICSENYTKYYNKFDRSTSPIFSDAASVFIFNKNNFKIENYSTYYQKNSFEYLCAYNSKKLVMQGSNVYSFVSSYVIPGLKLFLKKFKSKTIKKLYIHQASQLVIDTFKKKFIDYKFEIPSNLKKYGNTNASTIPLLIYDDLSKKKLKRGDFVVLCGFGVGLSYSIALLKIK